MKMKTKYVIVVGKENEIMGRSDWSYHASDKAAITHAKKECGKSGWFIVKDECGNEIASGGKKKS